MKAEQIVEALRNRHKPQSTMSAEWAVLSELRVSTGINIKKLKQNLQQRIDVWAINCFPSKGFHRIAYEIKVSRADFLHEIKHPEKRQRALELSHQFYFVVPKGLVKPEEIPEECGLMYVDDKLRTRIVKEAPIRENTAPPDWGFLASVARMGNEAEVQKLRAEKRDLNEYQLKLQEKIDELHREIFDLRRQLQA
ncbi:MmcB family DNA repair protein [Tumebacillus permanentifrigoris]|uniref:Uncharacterized protein DUF1052 n=1 Tax=Tumebacillus permanentifrigoris TaxID=378543 RepID=A0A316D799_9BACL|nr:MmcB family DNA repair protein [Tumebacillus permanentifrigoris]PWK05259.1 uncharacterized protein DUF1052 [Tumebacillus permanentifrigoris]